MIDREWKPIEGYEGLYEVSNLGEVKSLNYNRTGREKLLSLGKNRYGYLYVQLSKNGFVKVFRINRLVYSTFVGEIPEDMQVNHIDEDKENNRVDNLNLMTPKENIRWGTGIARRADVRRGKPNPKVAAAKSKAVQALDKVTGNVVYEFPSTMEAQRQGYGDHRNISACCNGKRKSHGGFIWRYSEK